MDFSNRNDPRESAREQQQERDRQQQQQRQTAMSKQSSAEMQRQLETQRQQAFHQAALDKSRSVADSKANAQSALGQHKKRMQDQAKKQNNLKRPERGDGVVKPQHTAPGGAVPPGPAPMQPEFKPGAALQQESKNEQVREIQKNGERAVLGGDRTVSVSEAKQLMSVASRLGISSKELFEKGAETRAAPSKQEIQAAIKTAEKVNVKPEVMTRLREAEREAAPEPERVKAKDVEQDRSR